VISAPLFCGLIEYYCPFIAISYREESVLARRKILSFNFYIFAYIKSSGLVGTGTPYFPWHRLKVFANCPSFYRRLAVIDRYNGATCQRFFFLDRWARAFGLIILGTRKKHSS